MGISEPNQKALIPYFFIFLPMPSDPVKLRRLAEGVTMKYKTLMFIGADNGTHKISADYLNSVLNVVCGYFENFSYGFSNGVYKGMKEESIIITIYTEQKQEETIIEMSEKLKTALRQESILVEQLKTNAILV